MRPQHNARRTRPLLRPPFLSAPVLATAIAVAGCGGAPPDRDFAQGEGGDVVADEESTAAFFVDPHFAGQASNLSIEGIAWGRLADVYEVLPNGELVLRHPNFLIGEDVVDGNGVTVHEQPITQRTNVRIHAALGTEEYDAAIEQLTAGLGVVSEASAVPRNAALSIRFSDLIDVESLGPDTVRIVVDLPEEHPFSARLLPDRNYGGTVEQDDGRTTFHPTRILIDPTVSESELLGSTDLDGSGSLSVNGTGFPQSISPAQANVALRLPTREDALSGQFRVLRNLTGNGLDPTAGPIEEGLATLPVVRAFRSGGLTSTTGDPNNGFLRDQRPPRIIGSQRVRIEEVRPGQEAGTFLVDYGFVTEPCALAPRAGDVLDVSGALAEFMVEGSVDGARVNSAQIRALGNDDFAEMTGLHALVLTPFDPSSEHVPACFVTVRPEPAEFPLRGVSPDLSVVLRFSEPMDTVALNGLEGIAATRTAEEPGPADIVVARMTQAPDLHTFTWEPALPLSHVQGEAETYTLRMDLGSTPAADLAGNALAVALPHLELELDANAPTDRNGGWVLRFETLDEDGNGFAELRGQYLKQDGRIIPRPVSRFSVRADREVPTVDNMQELPHGQFASPYDNGVFEPLTPHGSRTMMMWRYADLGLALQDESLFNIDVEGISWAPEAGTLIAENYPQFSMSLSHAARLPDEAADLTAPAIWVGDSGLVADSFSENILIDPEGGPTVVHERHQGYFVDPAEMFISDNGDRMVPFPMNQSGDPSSYRTFTWRDTAITATGGAGSLGLPIGGQVNSGELPDMASVGTVAPASFVPSIGLPLLIDVRTWPNSSGGHNAFDVLLGGFPTSFGFDLPANFRVHSSGGVNVNGQSIAVNPDTAATPSGGFHTVPAIATPGTPSAAADSLFYTGQLDLVVRVSRAHSIWIDTGGSPEFLEPITVPAPADQPAGTKIEFDFRGAAAVLGSPSIDAHSLDVYGDQPILGTSPGTYNDTSLKNYGISFLSDEAQIWSPELERLEGSRWVQTRMTFANNIATGSSPELRAVGIAYDLAD